MVEGALSLSCRTNGFRSEHLAAKVAEILGQPYTPRQASYDLKKLRAKSWVDRVGATRSYLASPSSQRQMAAAVLLREKVLLPLLSPRHHAVASPPRNANQDLNRHYLILQYELQQLLPLLGIAA
jgi:hypothetical protein